MKQLWRVMIMGVLCLYALPAGADGVLRFAVHTSPGSSLDPHQAMGSQDFTLADMVFNGLIRYAPGDLSRLEPDLALTIPEFELEGGRQVWHVTLREGVLFHAGPHNEPYPLTADDVIFSLKKAADPEWSVSHKDYAGMTFRKITDHSLDIILDTPVSPLFFLPKIANYRGGFIVSQKAIVSGGYEAFTAHPVGTGPFQFDHYDPEAPRCVLTAHASYFRGSPRLDGVELHYIPDNDQRDDAFLSGKMDAIYGSGEPGWIRRMMQTPGTLLDIFGPGYTGLFHFNTSLPPMDDIRVRQAISHALDREMLLSATTPVLVQPVLAPMSAAFLPGGMSNDRIITLNLAPEKNREKSRALLAEAGYPDGFAMTLHTSEKRVYRKLYEMLQQTLMEIGIAIDLRVVPHAEMHQLIRQNANAMVLYYTFRPNPDAYLRGFFHSESTAVAGAGAGNQTNFSHTTFADRLLDDARMEIDPMKQVSLWEQAQIKILNDFRVYPVMDIQNCVLRRDRVHYGHEVKSTLAGYPQFTENTRIMP